MKMINLTPHVCNIYNKDDMLILTVPPSGTVARCTEEVHERLSIEIDGVAVKMGSKTFGEIENLPASDEVTIYFVSALVANAAWAQGRTDVVCPLEAKRDDQGRIIGTYGLATSPK